MDLNVTLSQEEVSLIESAIDAATKDHAAYMKSGLAESDYEGQEDDLEAYKQYPEKWKAILVKLGVRDGAENRSEPEQAAKPYSSDLCPHCGSDQIEGKGVDVGEFGASQDCSCVDCYATWTLTFALTGYEFMEVPDGQED